MREWLVASALVQQEGALLLVQNRRRNGSHDWTPPGGVVEVADGEDVLTGLAREVAEETGLVVSEWAGPAYEVTAHAPGLGWRLRVEVHIAAAWSGDLQVGDDPDGIVVDARFVPVGECRELVGGHPWVCEPLGAWLVDGAAMVASWAYELEGEQLGEFRVTRV